MGMGIKRSLSRVMTTGFWPHTLSRHEWVDSSNLAFFSARGCDYVIDVCWFMKLCLNVLFFVVHIDQVYTCLRSRILLTFRYSVTVPTACFEIGGSNECFFLTLGSHGCSYLQL